MRHVAWQEPSVAANQALILRPNRQFTKDFVSFMKVSA